LSASSPTAPPPFTAVILAGGRSTRMGRDKARLDLDGQPLLARQIALARSLGPVEILISARRETDYRDFHCPVVPDRVPEAGPLAGIAAALEAARAPLGLVLAVDLPHLTRTVLERLLAACAPGRGVVPRLPAGPEPLAAVYPRAAAPLAQEALAARRLAARDFATACAQAGRVQFLDLPPELAPQFANWNTPRDIPAGPASFSSAG